MDGEILYSIIGIIGFIIIIFFTLRSGSKNIDVKTKGKKKEEIIFEYKSKLQNALDLIDDKELRTAKKTALIKKYSDELSRNIFFDSNEVREIVLELSAS